MGNQKDGTQLDDTVPARGVTRFRTVSANGIGDIDLISGAANAALAAKNNIWDVIIQPRSIGSTSTTHVRYWPKADIGECTAHVRFWG